jgi:integrase
MTTENDLQEKEGFDKTLPGLFQNPNYYKPILAYGIMRSGYPNYKNKESFEEVFNSLPEHNQKIITKYMDYCSITAGKSSLQKIRAKVIQIADIFNKDLDKLTLEDVRKFLAILNQSNRAIATKNDTIKTLKRFLRFQYPNWSNKFDSLKDAKTNTKHEGRDLNKGDLLTADEMQMIVGSVDSLKYKTILLIMQETANRPEELLKLKWKDINLETKEIKLNSSKTGETRTIPINESSAHLKRYKEECFYPFARSDDFVFPSPNHRDKPLTLQALSDFLDKLEKRLKFKKHLYCYLWRHSILSRMIKTLSPKVYEMYAGHSLETGMKTYAHLDTDDLRQELMSKIYNIEELTVKEKDQIKKLEKKIEGLIGEKNETAKGLVQMGNKILEIERKQAELKKENKEDAQLKKLLKLFMDVNSGKITKEEAVIQMKNSVSPR